MYIELLDNLRCVADHPQIPLVTAITDRDGRFVVTATMGCPTCKREYPIENGIACFTSPKSAIHPPVASTATREEAIRLAAFLDVSEGGVIALVGACATQSVEVAALNGARIFAVNSPAVLDESDRVGLIRAGKRLPFAEGALRGIAIDEPDWNSGDVEVAAHALGPGGRVVLPLTVELPPVLQEIARDDAIRVAEKRGPLVALQRR